MRRRLLLVLSLFSLLTVAAFVAPLLDQRATARAQVWTLTRSDDLDRFVALAALVAGGDDTVRDDLDRGARRNAELYGEGVLVVDAQRRTVVSAGLEPGDPGVPAALDAALRNQPADAPARLTPFDRDPVLLWQPVGTGTRADGAVLLRADPSRAASDVAVTWVLVLAGALAAAAVFAAIALLLARWVLRPVGALARGVGAVAQGRAGEQITVSDGPVELRALAESFNRMSASVRAGAEEQRRLVADASHQIRNPLAALRLRADGLDPYVGPGGRAAYDSTLGEVDRLERLLDGMLGLASAEATASAVAAGAADPARCDAGLVAAGRVDAWRPAADAAGVMLDGRAGRLDGGPDDATYDGVDDGVDVDWPDTDLEQVLDVLLDNAVRHTPAGTTVRVRWAGRPDGVTVSVADDGPGIAGTDLGRARERFWQGASPGAGGSSGLGLAIADRLAAAHGGRLDLGPAAGGGLLATLVLGRAR